MASRTSAALALISAGVTPAARPAKRRHHRPIRPMDAACISDDDQGRLLPSGTGSQAISPSSPKNRIDALSELLWLSACMLR